MARTQIKSGGFVQDPSLSYAIYAELHHPTAELSAILNTGPFSNAATGYTAWEDSPHANVGLHGGALTIGAGTVTLPSGGLAGIVNVWTGSAWENGVVNVWDGSAWVIRPVKVWNGSVWL